VKGKKKVKKDLDKEQNILENDNEEFNLEINIREVKKKEINI
jgi:hypothetical protein